MPYKNVFTILVEERDAGTRMDAFVASYLSECSRSLAADLILKGEIRVREAKKKPGYRIKSGDEIRGGIPAPEPVSYLPEHIELDILYEDKHLIVVNKQPGLVVHPAPGHHTGTLVNALLYHCPDLEGIGGKLRPGIVHRLDRDTSGVLVVAKNAGAQDHLSEQFKSRTVKKTYLALIHGEIGPETGTISLPIGRHPIHRKKMSTKSGRAREAETAWRVKERFPGAALLEVYLKTGRTHQIRVHCAAIRHPVIGDEVYGGSGTGKNLPKAVSLLIQSANRQMLHAWRLEFTHPATEERISIEAPVPQDMNDLIAGLRNAANL